MNRSLMRAPCRSRRRRPANPPAAAAGRDFISELPSHLLGNILSFLPVKEAARTAALSSHWRYLWYTAPLSLNLADLSGRGRRTGGDSLAWALYGVLSRHTGPARRVRISELDLPESERPWLESLCEAFEKKSIQRLSYEACSVGTVLPHALISSGSLSTLTMHQCRFLDPAAALKCLMNLRVLRLSGIGTLGRDLLAMISGLPMLLGLELRCCRVMGDLNLRFNSLERLGIGHFEGGAALTVDAPNLQELHVFAMRDDFRMDLEAMLSNLPKLQYLSLRSLCSISSALCIRSMSLKILSVDELRSVEVLAIDTPNLGYLRIERMHISKKDFDKMLASLPMLHTLHLISLYPSSLLERLCVTSQSLQHLEIGGYFGLKELSIVDTPSLQTALIANGIFNISNAEVINAPRISLGYLSYQRGIYPCRWRTIPKRILHVGGSLEL